MSLVLPPAFTGKPFETGPVDALVGGDVHCENNVWGTPPAGYVQKMYELDGDKVGWSWEGATGGEVFAYPEVYVGRKPWSLSPSSCLYLPRRLGDLKSLLVGIDYQHEGNGSHNAALEMWLMKKPNGGEVDIGAEVMIWLEHEGSIQPAGTKVVEGLEYNYTMFDLWMSQGFGEGLAWPYFAFVAQSPARGGAYNLLMMLEYLANRGSITEELYPSTVEFGNEIMNGDGWTIVNQFGVSGA